MLTNIGVSFISYLKNLLKIFIENFVKKNYNQNFNFLANIYKQQLKLVFYWNKFFGWILTF